MFIVLYALSTRAKPLKWQVNGCWSSFWSKQLHVWIKTGQTVILHTYWLRPMRRAKVSSTRSRIFSKTENFFSVFKKNLCPHEAFSNRMCGRAELLTYTWRHRIWKPPFSPVHTNTIYLVFKSPRWSVFENLPFWCPKSPFTCGR